MHRKTRLRGLGIPGLLLFLLITPPVAGEPPGEAQEEALWSLAVAPVDAGQNRELLVANLGGPVEETTYPFESDAGDEFIAYFLKGEGWSAWSCQFAGSYVLDRFVLEWFLLERNLTGISLPVSIGQTVEEVEKILGKGVFQGGKLTYDAPRRPVSVHRVTLRLAKGRVSAIEWVFEPRRPLCPHLDKVSGRIRKQ